MINLLFLVNNGLAFLNNMYFIAGRPILIYILAIYFHMDEYLFILKWKIQHENRKLNQIGNSLLVQNACKSINTLHINKNALLCLLSWYTIFVYWEYKQACIYFFAKGIWKIAILFTSFNS